MSLSRTQVKYLTSGVLLPLEDAEQIGESISTDCTQTQQLVCKRWEAIGCGHLCPRVARAPP